MELAQIARRWLVSLDAVATAAGETVWLAKRLNRRLAQQGCRHARAAGNHGACGGRAAGGGRGGARARLRESKDVQGQLQRAPLDLGEEADAAEAAGCISIAAMPLLALLAPPALFDAASCAVSPTIFTTTARAWPSPCVAVVMPRSCA